MSRGLNPRATIAFVEEHEMTKPMMSKLPCKLPGIAPTAIRRLRQSGIIARIEKDSNDITTWGPGVYFTAIMDAWK